MTAPPAAGPASPTPPASPLPPASPAALNATADRGRRRWALRLALPAMLVAVVTWAFVQGAHDHASGGTVDPTLATAAVDRHFVIDASTGVLDLSKIAVQPGEVVEFLLDGSAGAPHQFLLQGAGAAAIYTTTAPDGDTVLRLRAPESGGFSFYCTIPGHEGLHGALLVEPPAP